MHILWLSYNKFYIKIAYRLSICKDSLTLNKTKPLIYWELNNHANQRSEEFEIPIQGRTDTYEVTKISILGSSQDVQSPCRTQRTEQFPKKKKQISNASACISPSICHHILPTVGMWNMLEGENGE